MNKTPPLCNDCAAFANVPFTVGVCILRMTEGEVGAESITAMREKGRCGPEGKWFRLDQTAAMRRLYKRARVMAR